MTSLPLDAERPGRARSETSVFADLKTVPLLLLAVSGGPDSMALMILASRWATTLGGDAPALRVATVDHGLRPGSAGEAEIVAAAAARLGLPHATLSWLGEKPRTRVQERARDARYALLAAHAGAVGASVILTAHHADDQAETVLMRLARGSGIAGLAGMRRALALAPGLMLVRPLLDVPKAELVALCRAEAIATIDDPSNRDPAYARARLRAERDQIARLGLHREAMLRLARRAARADAALEAETNRVAALARRVPEVGGSATLDLAAHRELQPEILHRLVRRLVDRCGPGGARLERLERLVDKLVAALRDGEPHRATLGGARVVLGADARLCVSRAPSRRQRTVTATSIKEPG